MSRTHPQICSVSDVDPGYLSSLSCPLLHKICIDNRVQTICYCPLLKTMVRLQLWMLHPALALANSVNITYDDSNSSFFHWTGDWNIITPQTPCTKCFEQPIAVDTFNSTWHDGGPEFNSSGIGSSVVFNGLFYDWTLLEDPGSFY